MHQVMSAKKTERIVMICKKRNFDLPKGAGLAYINREKRAVLQLLV